MNLEKTNQKSEFRDDGEKIVKQNTSELFLDCLQEGAGIKRALMREPLSINYGCV